jgi:hypothetical protein
VNLTFSADNNNLERQLSNLFRAETEQAYLPQGTWHELAQRMGEPDGLSIARRLFDLLGFPRWSNPMILKYLATATTVIAIIVIAALSFVLTDSDGDAGAPEPAAESTLTQTDDDTTSTITLAVTAMPEPTPKPEADKSEPVTEFERFDVPGQIFRLDGDTIWANEPNVGMVQYTLDGELLQTVDLVAAGAGGDYRDFAIIDDVIWMIKGGQGPDERGIILLGTDGEIIDVDLFRGAAQIRSIATDGTEMWVGVNLDVDGSHTIFVISRFKTGESGRTEQQNWIPNEVHAMKFTDGSFWVSIQDGELFRFSTDGSILGSFVPPSTATAFDFDGEHIWVTFGGNVIRKLDRSGAEIATFEHDDVEFIAREIVYRDGFIWALFDSDSPLGSQVVRLDLGARPVSTHLDGMRVRGVQFTDDYAFFFSGYPSAPQIGLIRMPLTE